MTTIRQVGVMLLIVVASACGGGGSDSELPRQDDAAPTPISTTTPSATVAPAPTPTVVSARVWVGIDGHIFRSDDAGLSWRAISDERVRALRFVDRQRGWGIQTTYPFDIVRSDDGGVSWTSQTQNRERGNDVEVFASLAFIDRQRGVAVGEGAATVRSFSESPVLLVTDDGGATWRVPIVDTRGNEEFSRVAFGSICFTESGIGLTCGKSEFTSTVCMSSTDAGETWAVVPAPVDVPRTIACAGESDLWIVGSAIVHSRDAGLTWHGRTAGVPATRRRGISKLVFTDRLNGWMVGSTAVERADGTSTSIPFVLRTTTAGASWFEQILPDVTDRPLLGSEGNLVRIVAAPPMQLFTLGRRFASEQSLHAYAALDGSSWEEITVPPPPPSDLINVPLPPGHVISVRLTGLAVAP